MKRLAIPFIITLFLAIPTSLVAQQTDTVKLKGPHIQLEPEKIDLGKIEMGKLEASHGKVRFEVLNVGTSPLILRSATGCCGTEVKEFTKAPILPGKRGEILVEFRIEPRPQTIGRKVTIVSNALNSPTLEAHIVGAVVRDREKGRLPL